MPQATQQRQKWLLPASIAAAGLENNQSAIDHCDEAFAMVSIASRSASFKSDLSELEFIGICFSSPLPCLVF